MIKDNLNLTEEERLYLSLKGLYESYGYSRFQMRRFEEYSLYSDNLNFLRSKDIITFSGGDGRLLALKPDVTLSIVKNCKGLKKTRKVYYRESVYRPDRPGGQFREIGQIGLEYVGDVDEYAQLEVLSLAAESLKATGGGCVMEISHMGALKGVANECGREELPAEVAACVRARNLHDITCVCSDCDISEEVASKLKKLIGAEGGANDKIALLRSLFPENSRCISAADELEGALRSLGGQAKYFEVDFSLINDPAYYNGIVFQGYAEKSPRAVLSGGRYDNLVKKFGAGDGGIGFAIYPDELDYYTRGAADYDADVLVLYNKDALPADILSAVKSVSEGGESAFASREIPKGMRFKRTIKL